MLFNLNAKTQRRKTLKIIQRKDAKTQRRKEKEALRVPSFFVSLRLGVFALNFDEVLSVFTLN